MLRYGWNRILGLLVAIVLLTGCATVLPPETPSDTDGADNPFVPPVGGNGTAITTLPLQGRDYLFGVASYGTADEAMASGLFPSDLLGDDDLIYTGKPVSFDLCIAETFDEADMELGIKIWMDATPQPFSVGKATDITPCDEVVEYRFDAYGEKGYCIPISFTPVCGKAGEILPLRITFTCMPSYRIVDEAEANSMVWMDTVSYPRMIIMEQDAPTQQTLDAAFWDSSVEWNPEESSSGVIDLVATGSKNKERREELGDEAFFDPEINKEFYSKYGAHILRPNEDNTLDTLLLVDCQYLTRCYLQVLIDGEPVPLFDGKYYAETVIPPTPGQQYMFPLKIDLTKHPEARTIKYVCIPIPVEGFVYGQETGVYPPDIVNSTTAWIRYNDEI